MPCQTRHPVNAAVAGAREAGSKVALKVALKVAQRAVAGIQVPPSAEAAQVDAYIGVGGNLGDATATVRQALQALAALSATTLVKQSLLYRTAPIDSSGPDYINAVAHLRTGLSPLELLDRLQALENNSGRVRPYLNAPRTLDLDILLYGDRPIHSERLTVPHPRLWQRAFVLAPLAEIAPHLVSASQLAAVAGQGVQRLS